MDGSVATDEEGASPVSRTEGVIDQARTLRAHLDELLVWLRFQRQDPEAFPNALRSVGNALRFTGEDLVAHADELARANQ
ncbi:hypothetical protein ACFWY9_40410 [Amycolatopsis sp. NPDC059027]|uniref:hypothetical protein n=1 Tax=unclassified Amycolatopsis TaxID=2618356 RepID=UPI00366A5FE2